MAARVEVVIIGVSGQPQACSCGPGCGPMGCGPTGTLEDLVGQKDWLL